MNSDQVDWKELDLKGFDIWRIISGSIEGCDGLSGSIEDWCDADTITLGIILFMYELPVGRRQNQRICRFLFVFRKAPVLEFWLVSQEFARNVQNTSTKRESRTLSLKHLLFQVPCESPRLVNGPQTCSCWEFLVILSELQVLGSFRSNSDVVGWISVEKWRLDWVLPNFW